MKKTIKYNRVSTLQQSGQRFENDQTSYDLTLLDKVSGTIPFHKRPEGGKLVRMIEQGEVERLVIESIDRLGRNVIDISKTLELLNQYRVCLSVRSMGIESMVDGKANPTFTLIVQVMGAVAQMEREAIKERTTMGRAIAVSKGVKMGRSIGANETKEQFLSKHRDIQKFLSRRNSDEPTSLRDIAKMTGKSVNTVQKVIKVIEGR